VDSNGGGLSNGVAGAFFFFAGAAIAVVIRSRVSAEGKEDQAIRSLASDMHNRHLVSLHSDDTRATVSPAGLYHKLWVLGCPRVSCIASEWGSGGDIRRSWPR